MCGTVESRGSQTFVDLGFGIAAHSHGFPEEASCVARFECVHELFAAWWGEAFGQYFEMVVGLLASGLECGAYRLGLRDGDGDAWWVDSVIEWCGSRSVSGGGEVEVVVV